MDNEESKVCSRCGERKALTEFHRRSNRPGGVAPACKPCKALIAAEYRARNTTVCKERSLDWYRRNRERSIATTVTWQKANTERFKQKRAEWLARNKVEG